MKLHICAENAVAQDGTNHCQICGIVWPEGKKAPEPYWFDHDKDGRPVKRPLTPSEIERIKNKEV